MRANAVLTFKDEEGNEWLAGAIVGWLSKSDPENKLEQKMDPNDLKDRGFVLSRLTMVEQD